MTESNATIADAPPVSTGPIWAAILAAAAGCATLGVLTVLTELHVRFSHAMTFFKTVGDLSGATIVSLLVWVISWIFLHRRWRGRSIRYPGLAFALAVLLVLIGLLGTFPPVADWLARK